MSISQKPNVPDSEIILEMRGISRSFSGVDVLHNVDFDVRRGEVHVLLGENGAGKSTLMNILAGVYPCDTGQIWWYGQLVQFKTPREAQQAGISTIYQESSLNPHLSVAENVFLGQEPTRLPGLPLIDWEREKAVNVATAALQQNPEIDVFYGNSDEMGIGACIAAQKLGRKPNENVWCISIDGNDVTLDLIEKRGTTATLGVYPRRMGGMVIKQMEKILRGEKVPYILETPSIVVDVNNVAAYRSGSTWSEPVEGIPELDNGQPSGKSAGWSW